MTRLSDEWLSLPSIDLDPSRAALVAHILSGRLSPLAGFMTRRTLESVARAGRLPDGTPWLTPVVLPLPAALSHAEAGQRFVLRDLEGAPLATLTADDVWTEVDGQRAAGGTLAAPPRPAEPSSLPAAARPDRPQRADVAHIGWTRTIALPVTLAVTSDATNAAVAEAGDQGGLLWLVCESPSEDRLVPAQAVLNGVHAAIGAASAAVGAGPGAVGSRVVRCPIALPDARAARLLLQATLARACGATHVIVERGADTGPALPDGTTIVEAVRDLGLTPVPVATPALGDDDLLARLEAGTPLPDGVLPPGVEAALRRAVPPRAARGLTIFFTGLSGSGKSTIATRLRTRLRDAGRRVTLLDGDLVRRHLSSELGFSRAHRALNIERMAFVAAEIGRHRGTTICAPIAPYDATRRAARAMVEAAGGAFVLVYVDTPLAVCEARDRKGLYAKARAGLIPEFTGISDPYEPPADADITIETAAISPDAAVARIIEWLQGHGYVARLSG